MISLKKILFVDFKLSSKDSIVLEKGFLLPLLIAIVVVFILSAIGNALMGFKENMIIIPVVGSVIFIGIYFIAKKSENVSVIKWIFIFLIIVFVNLIWYFNYGSEGPWIYMIVLLYSYLIFMLSGWHLFWAIILISFNVGGLFAFDYYFNALIGSYPTEMNQIMDSYLSILIYLSITFVLMSLVKRYYYEEYRKAVLSDQLKSSFLTNMSHEIRTPLNAIVGFSNLLADGKMSQEDKESFREIINEGNQALLRLVGDILDVSLIESGQINLVEEPCDMNQMIEKLAVIYNPKLKEKDTTKFNLLIDIPTERINIKADCGRLQQILINLLDNAFKFTEEGEVILGFTVRENRVAFFVKDTGIGIEDKHLDHLFDRFYKVEDDPRKLYRGTGIGLFLVKKLIEYMEGNVEVHSVYGQGTQFYFDLPANDMKVFVPEKMPIVPGAERRTLNDSIFLVIEDDKVSSMFLDRMLKNEDVTVYRATDGEQGVEIFKKHPEINLVLLDIKLPGMDGFAILKELRKINNTIPVIAQTAMAMIGDRKKCLDAGFDEYVTKPINANLLMKKIQTFVLPSSTEKDI
ncbi:MAG: response regulator [Bacteroidales bacterium]|nr:response regulator [Bacteroidales bacterium]